MNILLNLIPIKKGGGQQVATNFISQANKDVNINITFLVTSGTKICELLKRQSVSNLIEISDSLTSRLKFNLFEIERIVEEQNIDIIYTLFGPGLKSKKIKSVTGCAYSNLFFPEIKFWKRYSHLNQIKFKLIDIYRLRSTLKSDAIIFENASMQTRAIELFNYPKNKTKLILPSISEYQQSLPSKNLTSQLEKIKLDKFNLLFLTGWHKNKNLEKIPEILYELKLLGIHSVQCVISVLRDHPESLKLIDKAQKLSVSENLTFIGSILPNDIPHLYNRIDGVGLLSLLESFSNNIIESWYFEKPLFITDAQWSRVICKNAAIYVNRDDEKDIALKILEYLENERLQNTIRTQSQAILKEYPSPKEKVDLQISFLKEQFYE